MTKNSEKKEESKEQQLIGIEQLAQKQQTPPHVFSAICTRNSWGAGKAVTEAEYKREVESFLESPIGRRN